MEPDRRDFLLGCAGALAGAAGLARGPLPAGRDDVDAAVRWIIGLPRDEALERAAADLRADRLKPAVLLGATFLAAAEEISPHPVGYKFHAAMVPAPVKQLAGDLDAPAARLPLLWCLDNFKASQLRDERAGDWKLGAPKVGGRTHDDGPLHRLRAALEAWDEDGADAAAAAAARSGDVDRAFDVLWEFAPRCLSNIGHKPIYAVMAKRSLEDLRPRHAERVLRSLARALLDRTYGTETDAWKPSIELADDVGGTWEGGKPDETASRELLDRLRSASQLEGARAARELLVRGVASASVWDGVIAAAAETVLSGPDIVCLHAMTAANALHTIGLRARAPRTRLLALLQAAAWMPYYRQRRHGDGALPAGAPRIDRLGADDAPPSAADARAHVLRAGADVHEFKFAGAVLEEAARVRPAFRPWVLATLPLHLPSEDGADRPILRRCRALLG